MDMYTLTNRHGTGREDHRPSAVTSPSFGSPIATAIWRTSCWATTPWSRISTARPTPTSAAFVGCVTSTGSPRACSPSTARRRRWPSTTAETPARRQHGLRQGLERQALTDVPKGRLPLSYSSPDGEEGLPGQLDIMVTYMLTHDDDLRIDDARRPTSRRGEPDQPHLLQPRGQGSATSSPATS